MTGSVFVNDIDIYTQYGVYIVQKGLNDCLSYPSTKEPDKNDWAEMDGIDVDLLNIYLSPKSFKIDFGIEKNGNLAGFLNLLTGEGYRIFDFDYAGVTKLLRVLSVPELSNDLIVTFSIEFSEDEPVLIESTSNKENENSGFLLNGKDLTEYGVYVLEGSVDSILKPFPIKQNLIRNLKNKSGQYHNSNRVRFKEKQVDINCLMRVNSKADFVINYNALLYDLCQNGALLFGYGGLTYECYYTSSKVKEFDIINDRFWFEFSLSFVFIKPGV